MGSSISEWALLGFGASSMQGVGDPEGGFFRRLEALQPIGREKTTFHNHGIGGNTTREMLARLPAAQAVRARTTVILLGCNDLPRAGDKNPAHRTELAEYGANLEKIFRALECSDKIFISSFLPDLKRSGLLPETFEAYMEAACALAAKHDWTIWDLYRESKGWGGTYLAEDGMHFGASGHALIAEKLAYMLWPERAPSVGPIA